MWTGLPAAHVVHAWGPGFPGSDAKVTATVDRFGSVALEWPALSQATWYRVYRAEARDGFHTGLRTLITTLVSTFTSYTDPDIVSESGSLYYMIVPVVDGAEGSSSYSVGVETLEFAGFRGFGPPARLDTWPSVSALADSLASSLGIIWTAWDAPAGRVVFVPHSRVMPVGVFDAPFAWAHGYEAEMRGIDQLTFVGY